MELDKKNCWLTHLKTAKRQPSHFTSLVPVQKDTLFQTLNSGIIFLVLEDSACSMAKY